MIKNEKTKQIRRFAFFLIEYECKTIWICNRRARREKKKRSNWKHLIKFSRSLR